MDARFVGAIACFEFRFQFGVYVFSLYTPNVYSLNKIYSARLQIFVGLCTILNAFWIFDAFVMFMAEYLLQYSATVDLAASDGTERERESIHALLLLFMKFGVEYKNAHTNIHWQCWYTLEHLFCDVRLNSENLFSCTILGSHSFVINLMLVCVCVCWEHQ